MSSLDAKIRQQVDKLLEERMAELENAQQKERQSFKDELKSRVDHV